MRTFNFFLVVLTALLFNSCGTSNKKATESNNQAMQWYNSSERGTDSNRQAVDWYNSTHRDVAAVDNSKTVQKPASTKKKKTQTESSKY